MKTFLPNAQASLDNRKWHVVDASGVVLGRLAAKVAMVIRGKHRPTFTPHLDTGDFVVVINAAKVVLTGNKEEDKTYMSYSGWKGGEKYETVAQRRTRKPELLIEHAVKGMLPKGRLGRSLNTKLKVYAGDKHPHTAQLPVTLVIK